jgi:hypothetical protein
LFWDNTNARLGVGTATPLTALSVNSLRPTISIRDTTGSTNTSYFGSFDDFLQIAVNRNPSTGVFTNTGKASAQISIEGSTSSGKIFFYATNTNGATPLEAMRINGTGNIGINTTTDAGYKLDVNGTARVNNDFTIGSNRYLKAFRWTNDDVTRALQIECNSNYNVDGLNIISFGNNLLNNTKNLVNIGLASTVTTQSSSSTDFFNSILIQTAYNFTFGTHTVKGIYYNPTLTAMVGTTHHAFHSTSGRIRFEGLPTSSAGLSAGDLWNNLGILSIV